MKTKFFRVATSGKTIDGREITPEQINQMAANYDPAKYGARINCEHLMSLRPQGEFPAYGDVLALKAEDDGKGNRVLLAQIDPTEDLIKLNKARQKVYWSIELNPNFAGTGEAYCQGLAITDNPASLGTEIIKFATQNKGALPDNLKSECVEADVFEAEDEPKPKGSDLFAKVKQILSGKEKSDDAKFSQVEQSTLAIAEQVTTLSRDLDAKAGTDTVTELQAEVTKLNQTVADLTAKLSKEPASPARQKSTGSASENMTDC
ncbi:MAG: GPO family capsid scaffolding protein [Rhodospirillales bacterium]|nr:GPO family capsid scaffolding protein [Rhodospirillales bacterium]MBR9816355.1 GPO family capsid scaffolding protein [Rhodospirillales bacterium]